MEYHIFNPDTEMALAAGGVSYTPPAAVKRYIERYSLLPALYAPEGATIIVEKSVMPHLHKLPYFDELIARDMTICAFESLSPDRVRPWGWNAALIQRLKKAGIPSELLPSEYQIEQLRRLAHRSLTEQIHEYLRSPRRPQFFSRLDEAIDRAEKMRESGFVAKLPWSSSGRGVFFNPDIHTLTQMMQRQHGVMIEPLWDNALDFATEWECRGGKVSFIGFSVFKSSDRGNYSGNIVASQDILRQHIEQYCDRRQLDTAAESLAGAIDRYIAPYYEGPLGVDMLCDRSGNINPCVEVNMRMTMGHVAIRLASRLKLSADKLYRFSPDKGLFTRTGH